MSDDTVPGALIAIGSAVFFLSKEELEAYRLPAAAATEALVGMAGGEKARAYTVHGNNPNEPLVVLAKYRPPTQEYGGGHQFPLTLSRMCW